MSDSVENRFKVRLIPMTALLYGKDPSSIREGMVAFDVTPTFSESRAVEYAPVAPVHTPGPIQVYRSTGARTFEIGAKLVSRNVADALKNMKYLQLLRGWQMPYFGKTDTLSASNKAARQQVGPSQSDETNYLLYGDDRQALDQQRVAEIGVQLRGAPPDVLYLYAYSAYSNDQRSATGFTTVNVNRVPVVITNLSITYPDDVDYIPVYDTTQGLPSSQAEPFPIKMDVTISLVETHSPSEYENFNLQAYKLGNLVSF